MSSPRGGAGAIRRREAVGPSSTASLKRRENEDFIKNVVFKEIEVTHR